MTNINNKENKQVAESSPIEITEEQAREFLVYQPLSPSEEDIEWARKNVWNCGEM